MTDLPDTPADDPTAPAPGDRDGGARALSADERALAACIALAAPQRGPSAELDARVLAMARAPASAVPIALAAADPSSASSGGASAGAAPAARDTRGVPARSHRRRRWPSMLGIAATLTLTFGLAWQMRPQDAAPIDASDAMRVPPAKTPGASGPRMDEAADSAMAPTPPPPRDITRDNGAAAGVVAEPAQSAASVAGEEADTSLQRAKTAPAAASASGAVEGIAPAPAAPAAPVSGSLSAPMAPAPAPPSAPTVFDDPSPIDAPAPAAPPAPSAARAAAQSKTEAAPAERSREAESKQRRTSNAAAEADAAAAAASSDARTELDSIEVTGTRIDGDSDQPLDDQPPASADSPAVREAWLARVRQLIADGRTDAARDSLREYRRRYPDAPIPDDLRPLLPGE